MSKGLTPKGALGRLIYEKMILRRIDGGRVWEAEDLAREVGITAKAVRDYVNDKSQPKTADLWLRLAGALELPVSALLVVAIGGDVARVSAPERILVQNALKGLGAEFEAALGAVKHSHSKPSAQIARNEARTGRRRKRA